MTARRKCGPNTVQEMNRRKEMIKMKLAQFRNVPYLQRPEVVRERTRLKLAKFRHRDDTC